MSTETFEIAVSDRGVHAPCQEHANSEMVVIMHGGKRYMSLRLVWPASFDVEVVKLCS